MLEIKFEEVTNKQNKEKAVLPKRKTSGSAGYDFFLPYDVEIAPHSTSSLLFTDIKAKMPQNFVLMLFIRSSLGIKKGLRLANVTGIIDSDYYNNPDNEGNIGIKIKNDSNETVLLKTGDSVVQGIFLRYYSVVNDNADSNREGGFGSTGQ